MKTIEERIITTLTYAGAIPFAACTLCFLVPGIGKEKMIWLALHSYAAIIISFLCGGQWLIALQSQKSAWLFLASNGLTLIAWACIFLTPPYGLLIHILCFGLLLWIDKKHYRSGIYEGWYINLRVRITVIVILCLLAAIGLSQIDGVIMS